MHTSKDSQPPSDLPVDPTVDGLCPSTGPRRFVLSGWFLNRVEPWEQYDLIGLKLRRLEHVRESRWMTTTTFIRSTPRGNCGKRRTIAPVSHPTIVAIHTCGTLLLPRSPMLVPLHPLAPLPPVALCLAPLCACQRRRHASPHTTLD